MSLLSSALEKIGRRGRVQEESNLQCFRVATRLSPILFCGHKMYIFGQYAYRSCLVSLEVQKLFPGILRYLLAGIFDAVGNVCCR